MKYKVGDRVRIRKDLAVGIGHDGARATESMLRYAGKVVKIRKVSPFFMGYGLDIDSEGYIWTDEMFEEVDKMGNVKIKIAVDGNTVIAKMGKETGIARCSPEDEFDFFIGAKLALERLEEKCKPYAWLKPRCDYWAPNFDSVTLCRASVWMDSGYDKMMLKRGLVFRIREEAIEAAKKMLAVLKESDNNE